MISPATLGESKVVFYGYSQAACTPRSKRREKQKVAKPLIRSATKNATLRGRLVASSHSSIGLPTASSASPSRYIQHATSALPHAMPVRSAITALFCNGHPPTVHPATHQYYLVRCDELIMHGRTWTCTSPTPMANKRMCEGPPTRPATVHNAPFCSRRPDGAANISVHATRKLG